MYSNVSSLMTSMMGHTTADLEDTKEHNVRFNAYSQIYKTQRTGIYKQVTAGEPELYGTTSNCYLYHGLFCRFIIYHCGKNSWKIFTELDVRLNHLLINEINDNEHLNLSNPVNTLCNNTI